MKPPDRVGLDLRPQAPAFGLIEGYQEVRDEVVKPLAHRLELNLLSERRSSQGRKNGLRRVEKLLEAEDKASVRTPQARVLNQEDRDDEAVEAYRRALEHEPDHREATLELFALLQYLRRTEEAAAVLERGLEQHPDDVDMLQCGVDVFERTGSQQKLREICERLLGLNPPPALREALEEKVKN